MQKALQPTYHNDVEVICACGSTLITGSVLEGPIRVEICSQCHPFFTGEKRLVDTEGRAEKFARQREEAEKIQTDIAQQAAKSSKKKKSEKKDDSKPLTLRELLQQGR